MLDDWSWLNLSGGFAQILGLVVAIRGVRTLKSDAFPGRPTPATEIVGDVTDFISYTLLRRSRPPTVISVPSIKSQSVVGTPLVVAMPRRPAGTASVDEILHYIDRMHEVESAQRAFATEQLNERADKLQDRVERNRRSVEEQINEQSRRVTLTLGGSDGRGLDTTWLGLVIAAIGLAAQCVAITLAAG